MRITLIRTIRLLVFILTIFMGWFLIDYIFFPTKPMREDPLIIKCIVSSLPILYIILALFPYKLIKKGLFRTVFLILLIIISLIFAIVLVTIPIFTPIIQNEGFVRILLIMIFCAVVILSNVWAFIEITKKGAREQN